MIKLDGSYGEGGGQIVRTALALSTALQKPFEVGNIRKGRKDSGLKAQHLTCLKALEQLCNAKFSDVGIGSTNLRYIPGEVKARKVEVDIGTAGSITLLLQSLLIPCFFANHPVILKIQGGTSGKWQMPFDYFENIFIPHLRKYADISAKLHKRGYYPRGGGSVELRINPMYSLENRNKAPKIDLVEQGTLTQIKGISHASKHLQKANVAERQTDAAKSALSELGVNVDIRTEYCATSSLGSGITLWAVFSKNMEPTEFNPSIIGSDVIGEKGKPAEEVGADAAKMLVKEIQSNAPVDECLADNLIPFLAMFGGIMKVSRISKHTETNIYVAEQFLGKIFEIDEKENIIYCNLGKGGKL
jgi:RNA 3'-phosphate cyclase